MSEPRFSVREFLLTYGSWLAVKQRCVYNSKYPGKTYKNKGIVLCQRWMDFANFIEDLGPRPGPEYSLDRFPDNKGDYRPGNCRWATAKQQAANTCKTILISSAAGETLSLKEWCRRTGLHDKALKKRLYQGETIDQILQDSLPRPPQINRGHLSFLEGRMHGKKLNNSDVASIIKKAEQGYSAERIGQFYGVSSSAICHVANQFGITFPKGRRKKLQIIGLAGFKGSGKDEVARHLVESRRFRRRAFADSLKEACQAVFGFSEEQVHGKLKEEVDRFWGLTPRHVMQKFGTEAVRDQLGKDTWVKNLELYATTIGGSIVVPDVRFTNECEMIKRLGGQVWLVSRPQVEPDLPTEQLHESERLPREAGIFDYVIHNDRNLEDLWCRIDMACDVRGIR